MSEMIRSRCGQYLIRKAASIYISRYNTGKQDVRVFGRTTDGSGVLYGKHRYQTDLLLAAESGEVLREFCSVPESIREEALALCDGARN